MGRCFCLLGMGICFHTIVNYYMGALLVSQERSIVVPGLRRLQTSTLANTPMVTTTQQDLNFSEAVHVVVTRFMQHQPHLVALGKARLELFKSICLQTMQSQDSQNFLWLIPVDPQLDPQLLEPMRRLVAPHSNFYLIRTLQSDIELSHIKTSLVESGDVSMLNQAIVAASVTLVVYTRLDADDGLANIALERLRQWAIKHVSYATYGTSKEWVTYCKSLHFEWHPSSISDRNESGGDLICSEQDECITPGLTIAFTPGTSFSDLPTTKHDLLERHMPQCHSMNEANCLHRLDGIKLPFAIRSRTVTSSGMRQVGMHVDPSEASLPCYWKHLEANFKITKQSLAGVQKYVNENVRAIAQEVSEPIGEESKCWKACLTIPCRYNSTKGHSCKESSKQRYGTEVFLYDRPGMACRPALRHRRPMLQGWNDTSLVQEQTFAVRFMVND